MRRLLPNHLLDLEAGLVRRWWPRAPRRVAAIGEVLDDACAILQGTLLAAGHRFPLALALSGGLDSRVVLAASKPIAGRLTAYSSRRVDMGPDHPDVTVSRRVALRAGLDHRLLVQSAEAPPELLAALAANAPDVHVARAPGMKTELDAFGQEYVAVTGNVAEVARGVYRKRQLARDAREGSQFAEFLGMPVTRFSASALDDWLAGVPAGCGYDTLDLCYWENRCGSWLASNCLEFDIAWRDVLMPFNHRGLIERMLAVPVTERLGTLPPLFRALIEHMWPELLAEPVNPAVSTSRLPAWARRFRAVTRKSALRGT